MKIRSIKKKTGTFKVYNFETKKNNNYFANGILVHNCSMGCTYCFAYFFKSNNPALKTADGGFNLKAVDVDKIIRALEGDPNTQRGRYLYEHFFKREFLLHWGGLADPFCHFEKANGIGYPLLEALGRLNYPTLFSFKGPTIFEDKYLSLFDKYSSQANFAFQVSIITNSDELARKVEIGVPSPTRRLEALKILSDMGYFTILRLRPFIIGVSEYDLQTLLDRALEAGIQGVSMEFFALDNRSNAGMKERYSWLAKLIGVKNLQAYFKKLSPSERGGYMRLNRMVKEVYVRQVYEFCWKHNLVYACSDPDFKELNTSGSCCGMPDYYPKNRKLENWSRSQLSYHIKELRKHFHLTGEKKDMIFSEVYGPEATYMDDIYFTNDHVGVSSMCNVERFRHTYRTILQHHWNNLRSYSNPRNYFHGKILPVGLDSENNFVYHYREDEYEKRWKDDGIDLTR
jgi:DNA repair photolyase